MDAEVVFLADVGDEFFEGLVVGEAAAADDGCFDVVFVHGIFVFCSAQR